MNKNELAGISLKKGDILAEIKVLDKLGELTTIDIAKSKSIAKVVKVSETDSFGNEQIIKKDDYVLVPKFHQITDKHFKADGKEFVIVNDQDIIINLKPINK